MSFDPRGLKYYHPFTTYGTSNWYNSSGSADKPVWFFENWAMDPYTKSVIYGSPPQVNQMMMVSLISEYGIFEYYTNTSSVSSVSDFSVCPGTMELIGVNGIYTSQAISGTLLSHALICIELNSVILLNYLGDSIPTWTGTTSLQIYINITETNTSTIHYYQIISDLTTPLTLPTSGTYPSSGGSFWFFPSIRLAIDIDESSSTYGRVYEYNSGWSEVCTSVSGLWDMNSQRCERCVMNCNEWGNDGSCVMCNSGYTNIPSLPSTCEECNATDVNCLECTTIQNGGTLSFQCSRCAAGYFWDSNASHPVCSQCLANCLNCNDSLSCNLCAPGYFLDINNTCSQCDPSCATCVSSSTQCLTCPMTLYYDTKYIACKCPPSSFYQVIQGSPYCFPCTTINTECSSCSVINNTQPVCLVCADGFYPDSVSGCLSCDKSCKTCSGSGNSSCLSCYSGMSLAWNGSCECSDGFYVDLSLTSPFCNICDPSCETCSGSGANSCLSCPSGFYFNSGNCLSCSTNCNSCNLDQNTCTSCREGYYLSSSSTCECPQGSYDSGSNCQLFNTISFCEKYAYNPSSSPQVSCTLCDDGYYIDSSSGTCQKCSETCYTCLNSTSDCLSCIPGLLLTVLNSNTGTGSCSCPSGSFINGTNCDSCSIAIPGCTSCSSATYCNQCDLGFYRDYSTNLCVKCDSPCMTCSSPGYCQSCFPGFILSLPYSNALSGSCICPKSYFPDLSNPQSPLCSPCLDNCLSCSNSMTCDLCDMGYVPSNTGLSCLACDPSCATCLPSDLTTCTSCLPGTFIYDDKYCVSQVTNATLTNLKMSNSTVSSTITSFSSNIGYINQGLQSVITTIGSFASETHKRRILQSSPQQNLITLTQSTQNTANKLQNLVIALIVIICLSFPLHLLITYGCIIVKYHKLHENKLYSAQIPDLVKQSPIRLDTIQPMIRQDTRLDNDKDDDEKKLDSNLFPPLKMNAPKIELSTKTVEIKSRDLE